MLPASGAAAQSSLLERWYTAVFDVNRVAISDLLAEDALIRLEDLGVTQTKTEYLESLEDWADVVKSANFAWQIDESETADDTAATALVCYQFPDKEVMIREVFAFRDGKIIAASQSTADDSCEDF
ncbi:hypothetical protein AWJ14_14205 [Hoeflea olei]|uniref:SnoaL-like domain-containing protein n=1 Tax=Hoeflea olei TaxID=1480615 RepID=A0A1C1YV94_9HYPH|nr:hypothetical protein AWJ14_14205 [Hoeflea olei]